MPDPLAMFEAEVTRVSTMRDGSPRFQFDSGEAANPLLSVFADMQANHRLLMVICWDLDDWERMEREG